MHLARLEPAFPATKPLPAYALDGTTTRVGYKYTTLTKLHFFQVPSPTSFQSSGLPNAVASPRHKVMPQTRRY